MIFTSHLWQYWAYFVTGSTALLTSIYHFPLRITKPTCLVRPSVEDVDAGGFKDLSTAKWLALFFSFLLFSSLVSSNVIKPMINQPQVILPFLRPMMNDACHIYIYTYIFLSGWWSTYPSEKLKVSWDYEIPTEK